jgi:xylose isomerase
MADKPAAKPVYIGEDGLTNYRFSFGPWNIHEGADPFGPTVRPTVEFADKVALYRDLGYEAIQFHDDDVVPNVSDRSHRSVMRRAGEVRKLIDGEGLQPEFVAPRLWEDARTIDGAYTSNSATDRQYARIRSRVAIDIADRLGTDLIVLWLAREGTYTRAAKDPKRSTDYLVGAINDMLGHNPNIRIAIEPKPNEPAGQAYIPTIGHAVALAYMTDDPSRVGVNLESAHVILANLDPSDEMGFAMAANKLLTVHLNDQEGPQFDQDLSFGSANLLRAFHQVRVLEQNGYGRNGEIVGLDVKAMRTQRADVATKHLKYSRETFETLLQKVRTLDEGAVAHLTEARDYEELNRLIKNHIMGVDTR